MGEREEEKELRGTEDTRSALLRSSPAGRQTVPRVRQFTRRPSLED